MAKEKKYYVVWVGRKTGVFDKWEDARAQVFGQEGAKYKSFPSPQAARAAFSDGWEKHYGGTGTSKTSPKKSTRDVGGPIINSIAVDAACSGNPGLMEYQGVYTKDKSNLFHQGPFKDGTNNIGEFLAIVHALAWLKQHDNNMVIYTDSQTAISWVKNKKAKTTLERTKDNGKLFELIDRAEKWLHANTWNNLLLKWETKAWGEIPADFGRK